MSTARQSKPDRATLARAIENKVERMDLAGLINLASVLNVPIPRASKATPKTENKPAARRKQQDDKVLQGRGIGPVVSAAEGSRLLDAITVEDSSSDWVESDLFGTGELAERLSVSRGTIDNWRKIGKIIALRKGLRNFVYPVRQFERLKPVDGIEQVTPFFPSPEEAWEWLVAPNRMTQDKPPIELLRQGNVPAVASAAEGAFDYA